MQDTSYVLVTAAYNEEQYIARTIESVVAQGLLPKAWVIVSDASTDATDDIVETYAKKHPFIRLLRIPEKHARGFAAQVNAINVGWASLWDTDFALFGNVDADVVFSPTYFESLVAKFHENPRLGLAGGVIQERDGSTIREVRGETLRSVPHALQLFRRKCYESIGGYPVLRHGGPDTYAEVMARIKGWEVEGFADLVVYHQRYTGSASGLLRGRFRQGQMDFSLGYDPIFQLVKCGRRIVEHPALLGAMVRLAGFLWAHFTLKERSVTEEFVHFIRAEQRQRLRDFFSVERYLANAKHS